MGQTQTHLGTHSNHRAVLRVRKTQNVYFKICNNVGYLIVTLILYIYFQKNLEALPCTCGLVDVT